MQLDPLTQRRGLIVQLSHVEPQGFDRGHMDREVLRKLRVLWVLPILLLSCDLFGLGYWRHVFWAHLRALRACR